MTWSSELGLFVAVAQTGTNRVAYSNDGLTWTEVAVSLNAWNGVIWSPSLGLFVAVADSGTGNRVMTSTNGMNWTDGTITNRSWETITWSEELGIFFVVATDGYIAYSSDGFTWIESVFTGENRGVAWSAELGIFVIVRIGGIYTSSLKNRPPSNTNLFDSEFNSINESGEWTFKALTTTDLIVNGGVDITGDLVVGTTNIITELGAKQATITSATDLTSNSITTTANATIGGTLNVSGSLSNPNQPTFRVIRTNTTTSCASGENLKFNEAGIDNRTAYNSTNFEYTIPVAGNWCFYYSFAGDDSAFKVQLQQDGNIRDEVTSVVVQIPTGYSVGCRSSVIIPCSLSDIRVRVATGSVALNYVSELNSFGGFLIG